MGTKSTLIQLFLPLLSMSQICIDFSSETQFIGEIIIIPQNLSVFNVTCRPISTLISAISTASFYPESEIRLKNLTISDFLLPQAEISTEIRLKAGGNRMTLIERFTVEKTGVVTFEDAVFISNGEEGIFKVFGALKIRNCDVNGWVGNAFVVEYEGSLVIDGCRFEGNANGIGDINNWEALIVENSEFYQNMGLFRLRKSIASKDSTVNVSKCVFSGNTNNSLFVIEISDSTFLSTVLFSSNIYLNNSATLFDLALTGVVLTLQSEMYENNTSDGIELSQIGGATNINDCLWVNTESSILFIYSLIGTVQVSDSEFTGRGKESYILLYNQRDFSTCEMILDNVTFSRTKNSDDSSLNGAIDAMLCSIFIRNSHFEDFHQDPIPLSSIIFASQVYFVMSDTSFSNIVGPEALIILMQSSSYIEHLSVSSSVLSGNSGLSMVGCRISMQSLSMRNINTTSTRRKFSHIFLEMSETNLRNVSIDGGNYWVISSIAAFYSNVYCENATFLNIFAQAVLLELVSEVHIVNSICDTCYVQHFAEVLRNSEVYYENIKLIRSQVGLGVFTAAGSSNISASEIEIDNSDISNVMSGERFIMNLVGLRVINSRVKVILHMIIQAEITLTNVQYENSIGGILSFGSSSLIRISDFNADSMISDISVFQLHSTDLVFFNATIHCVNAPNFAIIASNSSMNLTQVTVLNAIASTGVLMLTSFSNVWVNQSSFRNFSGTLIGSEGGNVYLSDSLFSDGGFTVDRKYGSQSRKGGVLKCTDCPRIDVMSVKVVNVSADIGGAIYSESTDGLSAMSIYKSSFEGCSAYMGGAAVVSNVSFDIQLSDFNGCFSESFGGALDITVSETHFRSIKSTRFIYNSAHEGGAIKWRNAEIIIENCIFFNNSAYYGPDIASYGFTLFILVSEPMAPGQAINITFNVLDHYGQQVTTASAQTLLLIPSSSMSFGGITNRQIIDGSFDFTDLEVFAPPLSNQTLHTIYKRDQLDMSAENEFSFSVNFRDCVPGEIKTINGCRLCNEGYFSLNPADSDCAICPELASCLGGAVISPHAGAWLTGLHDTPVVACLVKEHCLGSLNNTCSDGYEGPLCNQCEPGWFPLVLTSCWQCAHLGVFVMELTIVFLLFTSAMYVIFYFSIIVANPAKVFVVKTVISHVQILSLLSFVRVTFPATLQVFFRIFLDIATLNSATFPFSCFGFSYYANISMAAVLGIVSMIIAYAVLKMHHLCVPKPKSFCSEISTLAVFLAWFTPVTNFITTLPIFVCVSAGDSIERPLLYFQEQCWSGTHRSFLFAIVTPAIICNCIVPVLALLITSKSTAVVRFSGEYRSSRWEFAFIAIKITTVAGVILQEGLLPESQVLIGLLALYSAALVNGMINVFKFAQDLFIVQASNFILIASYSLTFAYIQFNSEGISNVIATLLIVLNVGFLVFSAKELCRSRKRKSRNISYCRSIVRGEENSVADPSAVVLQSAVD